MSNNLLKISVYGGKYTVVQDNTGHLRALRYGEEWRDCCGDGLILALAQEVEELKQLLQVANEPHKLFNAQDPDCSIELIGGESCSIE